MKIDYHARRNAYTNGITIQLAKRLRRSQIEAAEKLYARCRWWMLQENIFHTLRVTFPDFGLEATLVKLTVVDSWYKTNEYHIEYAAENIAHLLSHKLDYETSDPASLVEQLATFTTLNDNKPHHCWSLASKFAHFFIDNERFSIYDSYAKKMISYHLFGNFRDVYEDQSTPYVQFFQDFNLLKRLTGFECTNRELDRYLWLRGQFYTWRKGDKKIRDEVVELFTSSSKDIQDELNALDCEGPG